MPRLKLTARFESAFVYAAIAHADQPRKGTDIPYVSHLLPSRQLCWSMAATKTNRLLRYYTMSSKTPEDNRDFTM
jgi:hypothetical protein